MSFQSMKLEDFGAVRQAAPTAGASAGDLETTRLEGYEAGYQSGWEDANSEAQKTGKMVAADLQRSLADIGFTYEEARQEVLTGLKGLFDSILSGFLPAVAAEALAPLVHDELNNIVAGTDDAQCTLIANADAARQLSWMVESYLEADLQVAIEPAFADGRVALKIGDETRDINLTEMVTQITQAIRDFAHGTSLEGEVKHA